MRNFLREYNRRYKVTILLTSHYMADIQELCERVIVIHRGEKIYDGDLSAIESGQGTKQKIITFEPSLAETFPIDWESKHGKTTRSDDGKFTIRVPSDQVVGVSQEILSKGAVADITIEDIPIEDVITELFTQARKGVS